MVHCHRHLTWLWVFAMGLGVGLKWSDKQNNTNWLMAIGIFHDRGPWPWALALAVGLGSKWSDKEMNKPKHLWKSFNVAQHLLKSWGGNL